jgi:hypothetical protein
MLLCKIGFEVETVWFVEVFLFLQTSQLTSLKFSTMDMKNKWYVRLEKENVTG